MSRQEHEREDLLREATALVERAELIIPGLDEPVFVGFRRDGAASFFFGQERVYHFNAAGHLRRAYVTGTLYKADQRRLIALECQRTTTKTALLRHELSPEQATAMLAELESLLSQLENEIANARFTVTGQFPTETAIVPRLKCWLTAHRSSIAVAARPNVD